MLSLSDLASELKTRFGAVPLSTDADRERGLSFSIDAGKIVSALEYLKSDAETKFDGLEDLFAVEELAGLVVCYRVARWMHGGEWICIKVSVSKAKPGLSSIIKIWPGAYYYEVEASEMFGISFDGNREAVIDGGKRTSFLLPPDWQGHPMRKDYVFPQEYLGIEHRRPPLRKQHERP